MREHGGKTVAFDEYIFWDSVLHRWDITNQAICEQTNPQVRAVIDAVLRSWFIPPKAVQLPLQLEVS